MRRKVQCSRQGAHCREEPLTPQHAMSRGKQAQGTSEALQVGVWQATRAVALTDDGIEFDAQRKRGELWCGVHRHEASARSLRGATSPM